MSAALHLSSLDLDSQVQLLSRLQFLTRFSSHLVQVTGPEGAGKTWLSQRYLEHWADAAHQALLICHSNQTDSQHRHFILQQLAPRAVFNDQDPLQDSIERILGHSPLNALIVVDDAHLLSPVLVAELWALVQQAAQLPGWQVNVVLFSVPGRLNKSLSQVSHGQAGAPLELEISPLAEPEVQTFVEVMVADEPLDAQGRRWYREQAARCLPLPGELIKLEAEGSCDMETQDARRLSPTVMLVALIVLIAAGTAWVFWPATSPESERQALPLDNAVMVPLSDTPATDRPVIEDDSQNLPPEVASEGLTVGRSDGQQRVVVPAEVVDAMLDEQSLGGSGEQAVADNQARLQPALPEGAVASQSTQVASPSGPTATTSEASAPDQNVSDAKPEAKQAAVRQPASPTIKERGHQLRAVPASHYALQLAAMHSMTAANQFLADYQVANLATVYQTRRSGETWYIVVTGNYPNVAAARRAVQQLPAKVQGVQPWVKSYRQIHQEMDRAN